MQLTLVWQTWPRSWHPPLHVRLCERQQGLLLQFDLVAVGKED